MKLSMRCLLGVAALALTAAPAAAHFSEAMFQNREQTITGTVKDFQFMSPNVYLQIETQAGGKPTEWSLISEAPRFPSLISMSRSRSASRLEVASSSTRIFGCL